MKATPSHPRRFAAPLAAALLLGACATPRTVPSDYTAFKEARPASILVLPPLNSSPDVNATYSMMSQATFPLAESGYYVFPVTLVDETFKQNGLSSPPDIHGVSITRLRDIFGADAALYINVRQYGTSYVIVSSETRVTADAKLVDLRSGKVLWTGTATASSAEGNNNSGGGLVGMLVRAAIRQIAETVTNQGHVVAGQTSVRLLSAGRPNGILFGPRSLKPLKESVPAQ
ncbi:MAG TPA: DUF799 domain-containing protein [Accumulibacter sp.]|jgi:hypothetical protein|nr:DUF799 domain-containing protein [Accumulibacter sp.]HQC80821.1 DUF799 domain-containing protein [Accumulibacter sp.]